jgi:5,10-methylenetetrahydromethanopterin reductase
MVDIGIAFDGRNPLAALRAQARAAEAGGAAALWVSSHLFVRDPFSMAALALEATRRPRIVLMAVSPYAVHPVHIAMAAATLDELAPGRVIVCLGSGAPVDVADAGIAPRRRARTLREATEVVRLLLAGEPVKYQGEVFTVAGRRLEAGRHAVPVFLAAAGPRTLALAGAVADGVVLSTSSSVEFVRWALGEVERGARGRSLRRAALVYTAVADREAEALDRFRRQLAITFRSEHHARNLALAGTTLDQAAIRDAVAREDWVAAKRLVTDEVVRRHTASGTAAQVRERLARYAEAGLDEIVLAGLYTPDETRRALAACRDA